MCGNDLLALGALQAARIRGLRVPDDVAVTGFNDFEFAQFADPPLTTVRVPGYELGRLGAESLIARLGGEAAAGGRRARDAAGDAPAARFGVSEAFGILVGGEWRGSESGRTYEKRSPWQPDLVTGTFAAATAADAADASGRGCRGTAGLGRSAGGAPRRDLPGGRGGARRARRARRPGHDCGDGQAAPRGARRSVSRRDDPALRGGRVLAPRGRGVRGVGSGSDALHASATGRCCRPDHPLEFPRCDPRLEAGACAGVRQRRRAQARL